MDVDHDAIDRRDRAERAIRAIAVHAFATNVARTGELEIAVCAAADGHLSENGQLTAQRTAHQLAGSAGTFGYPMASEMGRSLEQFFSRGDFDDPRSLTLAGHWLNELRKDLAVAPHG